jgi:hypothetical protein
MVLHIHMKTQELVKTQVHTSSEFVGCSSRGHSYLQILLLDAVIVLANSWQVLGGL